MSKMDYLFLHGLIFVAGMIVEAILNDIFGGGK